MKKTSASATTDFVFEIGCEEIPAGMLCGAINELKVILEKYLNAHKLLPDGEAVQTYGAPRRLAALCNRVLLKQPDELRELTGPPKSVAYDAAGKPARAAESFAAKAGIPVADLSIISTPKGEYVCARQLIRGRTAQEIFEEILPRVVAEIPWPRAMYWTGARGLRFIRPIRWLVALCGGRPLKIQFADVKAGKFSCGHRFLGKARVPIRGAADYEKKLRGNYVIVRPEARRQKIESELRAIAARRGLQLHADAHLLGLVSNLNEYPSALLGDFDKGYLDLPEEILITVMRGHQKYFALEQKDGSLAPHFLAVINLDRDRAGLIRAGHERVLRARFADARFFWKTDQKCRLADFLPKLAAVTYQAKLGSYADKVERVRSIARWLAEQWFASGIALASVASVDRAAELAKCDLVAEMVHEFPELQGIVGGLYARAQGEPDEVAWAVYDHYRPAGLDDAIPRNLAGCAVGLADKLDTLVGCFAADLIPSGSSDPFALRRAALGVAKIVLERKLPVSLVASIARAARSIGTLPPKIQVGAETEARVLEFLLDRARFLLRERNGFAYDEIQAVFAAGADDLVDAVKRIEAIRSIRKTRNFEPLAVSFKRIWKILEKAGPSSAWRIPAVRADLFVEPAERELHAQAAAAAREAEQHKRAGKYREALQGIAALRPAVDKFFEDVMVMAEEEAVRKNRLTLLAGLLAEFSTIADFAELAASEKG